jgi:hypothetical protein
VVELPKAPSKEEYKGESVAAVLEGICKLMEESDDRRKAQIGISAVQCLLSISDTSPGRASKIYDEKYSVLSGGFVKPVFPAVLIAYRIFFGTN